MCVCGSVCCLVLCGTLLAVTILWRFYRSFFIGDRGKIWFCLYYLDTTCLEDQSRESVEKISIQMKCVKYSQAMINEVYIGMHTYWWPENVSCNLSFTLFYNYALLIETQLWELYLKVGAQFCFISYVIHNWIDLDCQTHVWYSILYNIVYYIVLYNILYFF